MKLRDLGFDQWVEAHATEFRQEGCSFARISAVDRGSYLIRDESREVPAELIGKLTYQIDSSADLPCVGDWVTANYYNNDTAAIIHRMFPRKTFFRRKTAGENVDYQMIAANIDIAFIVQSCHFDFNPRRLDRYLVMAADGHVEPVVILTKTDLITSDELQEKLAIVSSSTNTHHLNLWCFGCTIQARIDKLFCHHLSPFFDAALECPKLTVYEVPWVFFLEAAEEFFRDYIGVILQPAKDFQPDLFKRIFSGSPVTGLY